MFWHTLLDFLSRGSIYNFETFIAFLCIITYNHLTSCNNLGSVIGCHAELAAVGGGLDEVQDSVQYIETREGAFI